MQINMLVDQLLGEILSIISPVSNLKMDYRKIFEDLPRFFNNSLNKKYNANRPFCKDTWGKNDL